MLLILIIGGILLLLAAVVMVIALGLKSIFFEDEVEANPGIYVSVIKPTPTPFASPAPAAGCGPVIISSGDVQVTAPVPISLTVVGESFAVVAAAPEQEGWTYPSDNSGSAAWVCGMVVNYALGLEPIPDNETLLNSLRPGDEIKLHLSDGTVLFFRFIERRETEANEAGVFEQSRPRLTLILEKGDGTWQVATADYATETEPIAPTGERLAQPGELVHLGDLEFTVIEGHTEGSGLGLPPGTMYYLVELSIQNVGTEPLNADVFSMQLQDSAGNVYLLSPAAGVIGEHGPLGGQIGPGETVEGAAGYLVPETLAGPTLIWTFRPWPGSELQASVSIPYQGMEPEPPASAGRATVSIDDVFLDDDLLVIEGQVRNTGDGPLTLTVDDVVLSSSAGMGTLFVAAPPLPWTIEPGQTQFIELQYDKPDASTVLLTLAGHSFEIGGLE
jgi:hypothetical protein